MKCGEFLLNLPFTDYICRLAVGIIMGGVGAFMDFSWLGQGLAVVRGWPWSEVKDTLELTLYFLAVLAVFGCLARLGTIRTIIRDFREARGPLWDLRNTVTELKELEPVIRSLGNQVSLMDEKVDAARKGVAVLQMESISTRTDADDGGVVRDDVLVGTTSGASAQASSSTANAEDKNWQVLRELWKRNTLRLEYVIDQIVDGRTKLAYDRLQRTNYTRIVNKLQGQKLITVAAANASRELIDLFNSYRPRNRKVPDETVAGLLVLDRQLEKELVEFAKVRAVEIAEEAAIEPSTPVVGGSASRTPVRINGAVASSPNNSGHPTP